MSIDWFERLRRHPRLLPAKAKSRGAQLLDLLAHCHRTERLAPARLSGWQRAGLGLLAKHAVAQSPHFAARLKRAGLTPTALAEPGGLACLPPLTRGELMEAGGRAHCRSRPAGHGRAGLATTSGSTGEPVTVRRTELCDLYWMAYTAREHLWHGRNFSGRLAVVRANFDAPGDLPDWGPPCGLLFRTGAASYMPATHSTDELRRWLAAFDPRYLLILPNVLAGLIEEIPDGPSLFRSLREIRTLGETVAPSLRRAARDAWGCEIRDVYSSQECGIIATQCPEAGAYHVSETVILEVVDDGGRPCQPGCVGRVLLTDLVNYATPIVRYEIGDYAEAGGPCPCGRGSRTMARLVGRARNLVLLPDGTRHWPTFGFAHWRRICPIRQFQFRQHDRQSVEAHLVVPRRPTPRQEARLTRVIQKALCHPFAINYRWRKNALPRDPTGKFEEFLGLVK